MALAVVTGAARGIGLAISNRLADDGWMVAMLDVDQDAVAAAASGIAGAIGIGVDVADEQAVEATFNAFGEAPGLVVNNAGIVRFGPLMDLELSKFEAVLRVNLTATYIVARAAARRMATAGGGAIVNITSMNGIAPGPNAGSYGAAKAGVALLTQQMAVEWGHLGIRINCVAPGLIDGGMSEPIYADPLIREARESKVPLGRLGSSEASYITGQNLLVDGGVTMSIIAHLPRPAAVDTVGMTK